MSSNRNRSVGHVVAAIAVLAGTLILPGFPQWRTSLLLGAVAWAVQESGSENPVSGEVTSRGEKVAESPPVPVPPIEGRTEAQVQRSSPPLGPPPIGSPEAVGGADQNAKEPQESVSGLPRESGSPPDVSVSPVTPSGTTVPVSVPIYVEFENDEVSLLAEDMRFADVLSAVAQKAAFSVKVPPDVGSRRISVTLQAVPLERAIVRLFSLVQEKNYTVRYGPEGRIARVEVVNEKRGLSEPARGRQALPGRPSQGVPGKPVPANATLRPPQPIIQLPPYIPPTDPLAEPDSDAGSDTQGTQ